MELLGMEGMEIAHNKGKDGIVEIFFPSMSKMVKKSGIGCNCGYVVKMTGLTNET
jgi:hypothetical protein